MELRILTRLKAKDYIYFNFSKEGKVILPIFGFLFLISLASIFKNDYSVVRSLLILAFPFVYCVYVFLNAAKMARKSSIRESVFNENGVFSRDSNTESYWRFTDITKVVETGKYFYFSVWGTSTFVVPKYQLGTKENILFLRGLLLRFVPHDRLRLLRNDGSFNDNRKYSFDINKEIAIAENDSKNKQKYDNPVVLSVAVLVVIIVFSFFSDYLRKENGYTDSFVYEDWEYENEDGGYVKEYITASEKLLFVSDDVIKLAEGTAAVKEELALVKNDEIVSVQGEFFDYYGEEDYLKELDRLNYMLVNRLFEITDIRIKYADQDVSVYKADLDRLKADVVDLKKRCRVAIDKAKVEAEAEKKAKETENEEKQEELKKKAKSFDF